MIINVRGCSSKLGIIVSYLVENEEKTGYDSFNAKKIIVKSKVDMLAAIKKTLISSRKLSEINANDFISTINKIGRKNVFDTSLKTIVKSVNDETMQSTMSTLSHVYFNNKPLPQVKAINIINGNMYFMIKAGPNYNLEPIKNEKIKCIIVISSLVNLYRQIKQGGAPPNKSGFKKHYISARPTSARPTSARPVPRAVPSETIRNIYHSWSGRTTNNRDAEITAEPILEERAVNPSSPVVEEVVPPTDGSNWYGPTLYTYSEGTVTGRQRAEQRERIVESVYGGNTEVPQPEITNTAEEERPTERQAVANGDIFTITERPIRIEEIGRENNLTETPQPEITNIDGNERPMGCERVEREIAETTINNLTEINEDEENRLVGITLAEREAEEERRIDAEEERRDNLERLSEITDEIEEERPVIRPTRREAEIAAEIIEALVADENEEEEEDRPIEIDSAEREAEEERLTNTVEPGEIDEADEADGEEPAIRQAVTVSMRRAVSRQTEEERRMSPERRNSFVNYLRENQHVVFDNLQRNSTTSTSY